eukprot:7697401-Lingulodinium_polyedra.AAC.1
MTGARPAAWGMLGASASSRGAPLSRLPGRSAQAKTAQSRRRFSAPPPGRNPRQGPAPGLLPPPRA